MLVEAAHTTLANLLDLDHLAKAESERAAQEAERAARAGRGHAFPPGTPLLRAYSRRGCPDSLTFTEVDDFPTAIRSGGGSAGPGGRAASNYPRPMRCAVTGQPARYMDPLTRRPYADAAAFAVLRLRHGLQSTHTSLVAAGGGGGAGPAVSANSSSSMSGNHGLTEFGTGPAISSGRLQPAV